MKKAFNTSIDEDGNLLEPDWYKMLLPLPGDEGYEGPEYNPEPKPVKKKGFWK